MILLSPLSHIGSVHIRSCKCFDTIQDMIDFLMSVTRKWDKFSLCPEAFDLSPPFDIQRFDDEWHATYVYPFTLHTRMKQETEK